MLKNVSTIWRYNMRRSLTFMDITKTMKTVFILSIFVLAAFINISFAQRHMDTSKSIYIENSFNDNGTHENSKRSERVNHDLIILYREFESFQRDGGIGVFRPSNSLLKIIDGRVVIDAVASGDPSDLRSGLEAFGMEKIATYGAIVSGQLPIAAIDGIATLKSLEFARPAYARTNIEPHESD